jgi:hypothetical protein
MDWYRWLKNQWDRVAAVVAVVAGLAALVLGWWGVSGATLPAQQIPYLASGAVFGLFALGIGCTLWLSADLRDEWRRLDDIYRAVVADRDRTDAAPPARDAEHEPVAANGSRRRPLRGGSRV